MVARVPMESMITHVRVLRRILESSVKVTIVSLIRGGSRGRVQGVRTPLPEMTCGFLLQLIFCKKRKKTMWFIGVEVEQETSATPPKKNPGSAPANFGVKP